MKHFYSLALAAAVTLSASAAPGLPMKSLKDMPLPKRAVKIAKHGDAASTGLMRKALPGKNLNKTLSFKSSIAKARSAAEQEGAGLTESFEGWDYTPEWLPEGWSKVISAAKTHETSWHAAAGSEVELTVRDGKMAMVCPISTDSIDEWLITPAITVESGMKLSYHEMVAAVWLYSMENIDWDTEDYVGDPIEICDLEVLISDDNGATWNLLRSAADVNKTRSYADMAYDVTAYDFKNVTIDLAAYNGKTVKIAFRSVGSDTNLVAVDAVSVGYPAVSFDVVPPTSEYNLGLSKDFTMLQLSLAYNPALTPITWANYSENPGASYAWLYTDAEGTPVQSADTDLTVTYSPACALGSEDADNVFPYPSLYGAGDGYTSSQWQLNNAMVIGGRPGLHDNDGNFVNLGASYCDMNRDNFDMAVDYWTGEPIFGYGPHIDKYWSDYTFEGQQDENNWVKMTGILNIHLAPDAPMVIKGAWIPAMAKITPQAKFVMDIMKVSDEGEIDLTPIATDTVSGSEVIFTDSPDDLGFVTVPFTFSTPAVISSADCSMFVVRFSGFNDAENVTTFAPLNSQNPDVQGREIGWLWKDMCQNGNKNYSLSPISNYTGSPNGFYIMLDAEYSHLVAEKDEAVLPYNTPVEIALDTYRPAEELTVTGAPAWLNVQVSGHGTNGKLILTGTGSKDDAAEITVSGLGASTTIRVKMDPTTGLIIPTAATAPREYFNLQGMKVTTCTPGEIYILRQGTTASKIRF